MDRSKGSAGRLTDGGAEFAAFVDEELAFEIARRERAETRGAGLITSSSALTTFAFAGATIVTTQAGFHPPRVTLWALIPVMLCFLVAGFLGLRAGRVMRLSRISVVKIKEWDEEAPTMWESTSADARWALTGTKIGTLKSLREGTNNKMRAAFFGGIAQVVGLFFLTVAVVAVLVHASWPDQRWWLDMLQPLGS